MERHYKLYDVFTDERLAGNPLAVVMDSVGLDTAAMQKIAAEFNLSETVFVAPPRDPRHRAAIRIFTPHYEMPFAGHPTVGSAVALSEAGFGDSDAAIFTIEENIGPVRCAVSGSSSSRFAEFDLPQLPAEMPLSAEPSLVAAALGTRFEDIGFENHTIGLWSAGVPYITVPIVNADVARRVRLDSRLWRELAPVKPNGAFASVYVYTRDVTDGGSAFHARMFAAEGYEDPATGSAAAAFAGVINRFDAPTGGTHRFWIEQGIEMGRPSRIQLELEIADGEIRAARIGGHAIKVGEGRLFV